MTQKTIWPDWPLILAYHSISDERQDGLAVKTADFAHHMHWLAQRGYRSLTLRDFWRRPVPKGERIVIITFDDGYGDNYQNAFPILKRYDFVATVFLVSDYVDQDHVYWWDVLFVQNGQVRALYRPLTWPEIKEMAEYGIEFGSHTCSHPRQLTSLSPEEQRHEICQSRIDLQRRGDCDVTTFCYPRGSVDTAVINLVQQAGYECAVITPPRPDIPLNRYTLRRVSLYRENAPWVFRLKTTSIFRRHAEHIQRLRRFVAS